MANPFNGPCLIQSAGINGNDGLVHFFLKAADGTFDWSPFTAKPEQAREMLAIALAAITSGKGVQIKTQDFKVAWGPVWWLDINK